MEYNTQIQFATWGMDVGLPNHVKKWICKLSSLTLYSKYFN